MPHSSHHTHRIEIKTSVNDMRSKVQLNKIKVVDCKVIEVYTIEKHLSEHELKNIANALHNPISQNFRIDSHETETSFDWAIEIGFLPGVTDNVGTTARETIEDLLKTKFDLEKEGVFTSKLFLIKDPALKEKEIEKIANTLFNPLIERAHIKSHERFASENGMDIIVPRVHLQTEQKADIIDLNQMTDENLAELGKKGIANPDGSRRGPLALELDSLHVIRDYFKKEKRSPTDLELESLAQTWSEHCKHTIFAASMDDDLPDGLYKGLIKKATNKIRKHKGKNDFCVSVFKDNSGGIIFDGNWIVTDKAETHNSPSALDPFGGAITGIVGVNRDTIGFGKGAKPIANKYGYCFADPDDKEPLYKDKELKNQMLSPRRIIDGVVAGVNAGGNCSGIPTPQGWEYFDDRYKGKPLIFVGTIGLIPREINGKPREPLKNDGMQGDEEVTQEPYGHVRRQGNSEIDTALRVFQRFPSWEKKAMASDKIVMLGGRVGQDGIHGATFSSEALNEGSPAAAVQIGDPITQKKMSDAIVKEARDLNLYNSITDNGAGGLSCSVAEMAKECGGCIVELDKVPTKYPNLEPWKIWISESQERMTMSVPPEKLDELCNLMERRGVEATVIGEFTDSGRCVVTMNGTPIMDIGMEFLHEGLPEKHLTSVYTRPNNPEPSFQEPADLNQTLLDMLKRKNICSWSYISYQYDHMVQGMTAIYPLQGPGQVNNSASAVTPILGSSRAIIMSQGINPRYSDIDTYHMAACAIDTAVRNAVSLGADVDYIALMDNFCWCSSDEEERLGQLKASVQACYDYSTTYGTPFISGKDSMFNDFKGFDAKGNPAKISVPPTLLISSLGVIDDVKKAVTMDPKVIGDLVYIIGETKDELGASEYYDYVEKGLVGKNVPQVADASASYKLYKTFKKAVDKELLASSLSLVFGGVGIGLAKKVISGQLGLEIDISKVPTKESLRNDYLLFSETQSRFLVTINPKNKARFEKVLAKHIFAEIGRVIEGPSLIIKNSDKEIINLSIKDLDKAYKSTFSARG
ncbi:MAG: AIR synthase-related protein [Candidatus Gracilibacteria bacterium]